MDLSKVFEPVINRSTSIDQVANLGSLFGMSGVTSKKGTPINEYSSLTLSGMFNGIELITNDVAILPIGIFQRDGDSRHSRTDHPLHFILNTRPNRLMVPFMLKKMLVFDAIMKGNGYARIIRHPGSGVPMEIRFIDQVETPVEVYKLNHELFYKVGNERIADDDMIRIPGFTVNGITGVSVIRYAAHSLGVDLSSMEYASEYYNQKGIGTGVVTAAKPMDNDAKKRLGDAMATMFNRKDHWTVPILDEMSNFHHIKITPQESQFLMVHKEGIAEIARFLNLPMFKLKNTENINNSITQSLLIAYVQETIIPWARKIEQEFQIKLFTLDEITGGHYFKLKTAVLLEADPKTKAEYYSKSLNFGWMVPNEVRAKEDMNPIPGGDVPMRPANMLTIEQIANQEKEKDNE